MIRVGIFNISRRRIPPQSAIKKAVKRSFALSGIRDADISVVFVSDGKIKKLNAAYRGKNRPTDVLSFNMGSGRGLRGQSIRGDIFISVDRASEQAMAFGSTFKNEIFLYTVHGALHLLGLCDHSLSSAKKMRRKETEVMARLGRI